MQKQTWPLSACTGVGTLRRLSEPAPSSSPPAGPDMGIAPFRLPGQGYHPDPESAVEVTLEMCSSLSSAFSSHHSPLCSAFYLKLLFNNNPCMLSRSSGWSLVHILLQKTRAHVETSKTARKLGAQWKEKQDGSLHTQPCLPDPRVSRTTRLDFTLSQAALA